MESQVNHKNFINFLYRIISISFSALLLNKGIVNLFVWLSGIFNLQWVVSSEGFTAQHSYLACMVLYIKPSKLYYANTFYRSHFNLIFIAGGGGLFLCRLRSIAAPRDLFVWRLSVHLSGSHTFLVVTHSYVSQATHAFLGMLPLCWFSLHVLVTMQTLVNQHLAYSARLYLKTIKKKCLKLFLKYLKIKKQKTIIAHYIQ